MKNMIGSVAAALLCSTVAGGCCAAPSVNRVGKCDFAERSIANVSKNDVGACFIVRSNPELVVHAAKPNIFHTGCPVRVTTAAQKTTPQNECVPLPPELQVKADDQFRITAFEKGPLELSYRSADGGVSFSGMQLQPVIPSGTSSAIAYHGILAGAKLSDNTVRNLDIYVYLIDKPVDNIGDSLEKYYRIEFFDLAASDKCLLERPSATSKGTDCHNANGPFPVQGSSGGGGEPPPK